MDEMHDKANSFTKHFFEIRKTVAETFNAQLEEYTTAVDSGSNYGLDSRFGD